jgi:hypothetical protein
MASLLMTTIETMTTTAIETLETTIGIEMPAAIRTTRAIPTIPIDRTPTTIETTHTAIGTTAMSNAAPTTIVDIRMGIALAIGS